ncbi:MAG: acetyl-CoA acetyltransferase [Caulobacter sp.]|nr:acetyl-CoA acetyltransferase [Caulobacter sp.]
MRDDTPVLIGAGQFTYRGKPESAPSPLELLKIAAERAAADAGIDLAALAQLDAVAVVGFTVDAPGALQNLPFPRLKNPPASLAQALGATPTYAPYSHMGGNSPQQLINILSERIQKGETDFAFVSGAEFLGSLMKRLKGGAAFDDYSEGVGGEPERIGDPRPGATPYESAHGLDRPINIYPVFENALRALITVTEKNRMIGFPYPKNLNAIMQVDQSAGVLLCSVKKARALGVPQEKWVFLHGCADASDLWFPLDRQNYHSSPAMRLTGQRALEMAGVTIDDIDVIDLYSCFPIAVEVGAEELGIALDDPRGLTVTGGLPYFGGPGNNYAMHSIAEMMQRLRAKPGAWGLCTANGWFLTKQSTGVYSTTPPDRPFDRQDPKIIQAQIDALPHPEIVETPEGRGTIEAYTVIHDREAYRGGVVIGRDEQGRRFVAVTPNDPAVLKSLETAEGVGRTGVVSRHPDGKRNLFVPD